jgi:hypothetical protein
LAVFAAVLALLTAGCGGSSGTRRTFSGPRFDSTKAIAAALYGESFDIHGCSEPAPTALSERGVRCLHIKPNGGEEAVALDVYASDDQEDRARDKLSDGGDWAETLWGDRWSVSSKSRATAAEVREALIEWRSDFAP